jgi:uncharacterized phage-associated protein
MESTFQKPLNYKLKQVTHYLLHKCAGQKTFGKTVLFKLLYFIDFNFYKLHYKSITGENYRKLLYGPAPCNFDKVITALSEEGEVKVFANENTGAYNYKVIKEPTLEGFDRQEVEIIEKVIRKIGNCTAAEISQLSHADTPWQVTEEKGIIDYDLVFYRDEAISLRVE